MLEQLIDIDHQFFLGVNQGMANAFFDWLMPLLRNRYFWVPLYFFLIVFLIRNYKRNGVICILFLLGTFAIADYFSASILKHIFERLRPCNEPGFKDEIRLLVSCGSGFSFPSSHACNHFAIGMFLNTVFYDRWKPILPLSMLWALSIAFAQVYVGVHFPIDITVGGLLGCLIGYITGTIFLTTYMQKTWKSGN